jgi:hypothetical protein
MGIVLLHLPLAELLPTSLKTAYTAPLHSLPAATPQQLHNELMLAFKQTIGFIPVTLAALIQLEPYARLLPALYLDGVDVLANAAEVLVDTLAAGVDLLRVDTILGVEVLHLPCCHHAQDQQQSKKLGSVTSGA